MITPLWIINTLLAFAFLASGGMKIVRRPEALKKVGMLWVDDFPPAAVKAIGGVEVIGAIGLILPFFTGILPLLTPIAATGLSLVMILAVITHVRRSESALPSIVLGALSVVSAVLGFLVVLG